MAALVVISRLVPIQIRASSSVSTSQLPSSSSSFTVKYLVDSCGLQLQSAIAASRKLDKKKLNENNIHRSDSVLNLLESYGFERTHIVEIIRKRPDMLTHFRSGKFLRPKMEYLVEMGISGSDLHDLIVMNPNILFVGLNSKLKSRFESLIDSVGTNERARAALMVCPWLLTEDYWKPNVDFLLREGVAVDTLFKLIANRKMAIKRNVDEMVRAIEIVRKVGINPATDKFLNAVLVVANFPLWEKKVKVFSDFGLSEGEIMSILRLRPNCFDYSEKRLRRSFEFLVNTMNMSPKTISSRPVLLSYGIDKRVRPRCNVVKLLWSLKLLGEGDAKLARALVKTEELFLKDYVYKHLHRVPNLLDVYRGETTTKETA